MTDSVRNQVRELIGALSHLDGLLSEADALPALHAARLVCKLDDVQRTVDELVDATERLVGPTPRRATR